MNFARLCTSRMRAPFKASDRRDGGVGRVVRLLAMMGERIVRPMTCGRRCRTRISTSGSSGTTLPSEEAAPGLSDLGLDVERFGPTAMIVRAVPAALGKPDVAALLAEDN